MGKESSMNVIERSALTSENCERIRHNVVKQSVGCCAQYTAFLHNVVT